MNDTFFYPIAYPPTRARQISLPIGPPKQTVCPTDLIQWPFYRQRTPSTLLGCPRSHAVRREEGTAALKRPFILAFVDYPLAGAALEVTFVTVESQARWIGRPGGTAGFPTKPSRSGPQQVFCKA